MAASLYYSELGHGSKFKSYLPVAENQVIEVKQDEKMNSAFLAGTERILLVDDEKAILLTFVPGSVKISPLKSQ